MNKKHTLISLAILTAFYSQQSLADLHEQCLMGVPKFSGEIVTGDVNSLPVYIEADNAEINQPNDATYQGNVDLKQGNRHLLAQSVQVKQSGNQQGLYVWLMSAMDLIIKIIRSICWVKMRNLI